MLRFARTVSLSLTCSSKFHSILDSRHGGSFLQASLVALYTVTPTIPYRGCIGKGCSDLELFSGCVIQADWGFFDGASVWLQVRLVAEATRKAVSRKDQFSEKSPARFGLTLHRGSTLRRRDSKRATTIHFVKRASRRKWIPACAGMTDGGQSAARRTEWLDAPSSRFEACYDYPLRPTRKPPPMDSRLRGNDEWGGHKVRAAHNKVRAAHKPLPVRWSCNDTPSLITVSLPTELPASSADRTKQPYCRSSSCSLPR